MRSWLWLSSRLFPTVIAAAAAAQPPSYTVQILPGVAPGAGMTLAQAINNSGVVVGASSMSVMGGPDEFRLRAIRWTGGVPAELPELPSADPMGIQGGARDINDAGITVGSSRFDVGGMNAHSGARAVRWDGTTPTDLGLVAGSVITSATSISSGPAPHVAGFSLSGFFANSTRTALRWNGTTPEALGRLPTHTSSFARGVNASGRIVGYSAEFEGDFTPSRPVYWDAMTATPLTPMMGHEFGSANAVNDAGLIAGQSTGFDDVTFEFTGARAVVWNPAMGGLPTALPLLPGTQASSAMRITSSGAVLGVSGGIADIGSDFFGATITLWDGPNVYDLSSILSSLIPAENRDFFTVNDINNAGQLVGSASYSDPDTGDFYSVAFVATPVPAPAGATLVMVGAGLIAMRRRHRSPTLTNVCERR